MHLPEHAQHLHREVFRRACAAHRGEPHQEQAARRLAGAAVKRGDLRQGNLWWRAPEAAA